MALVERPVKLALAVVFSVVSFLSFLALSQLPSALNRIVNERSELLHGTMAAKLFQNIPFGVRQNVYLFNITNKDEFFKGAKPHFEELGPYVFKLTLTKEMVWDDNKTLTFREHRLFKFAPELSSGQLNDSVITVDATYAVVQKLYLTLPGFVKKIIGPMLEKRSILFERTAGELLYDGYPDPWASISHFFKPDLPVIDGRIGYLRALNNTDDGTMTVNTGYDSTESMRNVVFKWNETKHIPYYGDECNQLWGTNAELFPAFHPLKPLKEIGIFQPVFCKPWKLHFNESVYEDGLDLVRYTSGSDFFSPTGDIDFDKCLQPGGWQRGTFDVSVCQHGFPALMSLPHFLGAEECLAEVEGLKPNNSTHAFEMLIYPSLGLPVKPALRAQINVRIHRHFDINARKSVDNNSIVYPVLWQEIVLSDTDSEYISSMIWWTVKVPRLGLCSLALLMCALGFFFAGKFGKESFVERKYDEERQPVLMDVEEDEPSQAFA